jgi:hypothetical protein
MKKVFIFALIALIFGGATASAEVGGSVTRSTNSSSKILDTSCVKTAVSVREDSLMKRFDAFNTTAKTALEARKAALLLSWDKTDNNERRASRKAAYDAYSKTIKAAHTTIRTDRKAAWAIFNTEVKKCSGAKTYTETSPVSQESTVL